MSTNPKNEKGGERVTPETINIIKKIMLAAYGTSGPPQGKTTLESSDSVSPSWDSGKRAESDFPKYKKIKRTLFFIVLCLCILYPPYIIKTSSTMRSMSTCENALGRTQVIELSLDQCVTFTATSTQQKFFIVLKSAPKSIEGEAAFGHLREETDADKAARKARCLTDTGNEELCKKELALRTSVLVDECISKFRQDKCLSYLHRKQQQGSIPLVVRTEETVRINMLTKEDFYTR